MPDRSDSLTQCRGNRTIACVQSPMKAETLIKRHHAIVYDGEIIQDPSLLLFDPDHWAASGRVLGSAAGRGTAWFLDTSFGPAVLRRYHRGGWAARFSQDRYLYIGPRRSRPFREFELLARLREQGLPVPEPLAAVCEHRGMLSRGALLTRTLAKVTALADLLPGGLAPERWRAIGACIARFHAAGVVHADLNARNILVRETGDEVFLVDFDRGRYRPGKSSLDPSRLLRLHRSLHKLWPARAKEGLASCWADLNEGYHG